jgi:hypothetical protein
MDDCSCIIVVINLNYLSMIFISFVNMLLNEYIYMNLFRKSIVLIYRFKITAVLLYSLLVSAAVHSCNFR